MRPIFYNFNSLFGYSIEAINRDKSYFRMFIIEPQFTGFGGPIRESSLDLRGYEGQQFDVKFDLPQNGYDVSLPFSLVGICLTEDGWPVLYRKSDLGFDVAVFLNIKNIIRKRTSLPISYLKLTKIVITLDGV